MSLVEAKYIESTDGIKKTIDKGSMSMALDILQRGLYARPIQSTVRELASNGYDAIVERDVAKSIILGQSSIEDHFDVTKIDGIFHASGWDPTYFDLAWLSDDPNCYLYYDEGVQKDVLRIVDHGVGLGKTRLVNYFMLNWSSKRASKDTLGNKGLGSKVALSLGVTSFRVITKYNGRKFKFDVFLDKVESVIPKFNSKGVANEPFILVPEKTQVNDAGETEIIPAYIAYCEATEDKNGVEIQIEVKKHNKKLFFEAIESQLMYMPAIKFMVKNINDTLYTHKNIAAEILYRDENVILSKSTVFDKPHILLGVGNALVCYGVVSFNDLELEPKRGSVGLILDINDIEVTPSREAPIWSAKTREAVLAKYKMVSEMASKYLNQELASETDYLKWIIKAAQILTSLRQGGSNTSVLSRLASIVHIDDIGSVVFLGSNIVFDDKPKEMFGASLTVRNVSYNQYEKKVKREALTDLCTLSRPIYFTSVGSNPFKDRYLYEENGHFVLINVKFEAILDSKGQEVSRSTALLDYDAVVVPEDRMELYLADKEDVGEDEDATDAKSAPKVDYSAARKANKQIVIHKVSGTGGVYDYKFSTQEHYISDLFSLFQDELVIYTTGGDRETMSDLLAIFPQDMISCGYSDKFTNFISTCTHMPLPTRKRLTGILLAQENVKYVQKASKYMSISDFLLKSYDKKSGTIVFSDLIKFAATNSVIASIFRAKFKRNVRITYPHISKVAPKFQGLASFCYDFYDNSSCKPLKDIMSREGFLKDIVTYQLYKSNIFEASDEAIDALKDSINSSLPDYLCDVVDDINNIDILDLDVVQSCSQLFNYYKDYEILEAFSYGHSYWQPYKEDIVAKQVIEWYKFLNNKL